MENVAIVQEECLDTLPEGLYQLPDRKYIENMYVPSTNDVVSGNFVLMVRIRRSDKIPEGVEICIRSDGMQIIKQWVLDPE